MLMHTYKHIYTHICFLQITGKDSQKALSRHQTCWPDLAWISHSPGLREIKRLLSIRHPVCGTLLQLY